MNTMGPIATPPIVTPVTFTKCVPLMVTGVPPAIAPLVGPTPLTVIGVVTATAPLIALTRPALVAVRV